MTCKSRADIILFQICWLWRLMWLTSRPPCWSQFTSPSVGGAKPTCKFQQQLCLLFYMKVTHVIRQIQLNFIVIVQIFFFFTRQLNTDLICDHKWKINKDKLTKSVSEFTISIKCILYIIKTHTVCNYKINLFSSCTCLSLLAIKSSRYTFFHLPGQPGKWVGNLLAQNQFFTCPYGYQITK